MRFLQALVSEGHVYVIDRVVAQPGRGREFVDRYLTEYAPGARERGMTLRDILVSPPVWLTDRANIVTVTWQLPSARAWWEMTWKGRPDAKIGLWWADVEQLISARSRSVAAAADDIDGLCDV